MHSYHQHNDHYEHHAQRYRRGRYHVDRHHRQRSQERRLPSSSAAYKKRQRSEDLYVDRGRVKRNHFDASSPSANKFMRDSFKMRAPGRELTPVKKSVNPDNTLDEVTKAATPGSSDKDSTQESSSDNASTPKVSTPKVSTPEKEPVKETVIALEADEEEEKAVMEPILSSMNASPVTTPRSVPEQPRSAQEPQSMPDKTDEQWLPRQWKQMKSRTGQKYYYNKDTGKSTWDRPTAERRQSSPEQPFPLHRSRDEPRPVAQNLVHRPVGNRAPPSSYDRGYQRTRYEEQPWMSRRDGRGFRGRNAYFYERNYGRVSRGYR